MQFTSVIAAAVLAYVAFAAPTTHSVTSSTTHSSTASKTTPHSTTSKTTLLSTTSTTTHPSSTSIATVATPTILSLTQQLFLADTAVDRFALLTDADMKFSFANPAKMGKGGKGGDLIAANRKTFPALVGTGAGMAVGFLGPCGFNTPHVHPRSVELQIVTKGTLIVEMVPENGVMDPKDSTMRRVIMNKVTENEMTPFYMGSVHTQYNPNCEPAAFVAAFTNEDFGAGQIADELFSLTSNVVNAAFGTTAEGADIESFKGRIPASIAEGVEKCLKQCKISKRSM